MGYPEPKSGNPKPAQGPYPEPMGGAPVGPASTDNLGVINSGNAGDGAQK